MKVTMYETNWGNIEVSTEDNRMVVQIDENTGAVDDITVSTLNNGVSIQELASFINKARTEYNRLINKRKAQEFIEGGK